MSGGGSEKRGTLFVISAPSGVGKSTLARRLLESVEGLEFSVSYTTRPRRRGEADGREYHFVDDARFEAMAAEDAFLEQARVFGRWYGTGRDATERALAAGRDLLLDIDVQGARQVRERHAEAVFVFVLPPDYRTLERRLLERHSEGEAERSRRLSLSRGEGQDYEHYDYLIVNDDLDRAIAGLRSIVEAERHRVSRRRAEAERILSTFPAV